VKLRLAVLAASMICCAAEARAGTPLFDVFKMICMDTGANPDAANKAAEAAGGQAGQYVRSDDPFPMTMRFWTLSKNLSLVVGTQNEAAFGNTPAENSTSCTMTSRFADKEGLARLRGWAGIPSQHSASLDVYSFQDLNGKHIPMPKDRAAYYKTQDTGHTWMLSVFDEGGGAILILTHYLAP
jgi:hypothetical protein